MKGDEFFRRMAAQPPFNRLSPQLAGFFKHYFRQEKVIPFGRQSVVNTHFPPFPSPALDQLVNHFNALGSAENRRLYSVTLAVTNRCQFNCWHCYNAGRCQTDIPLPVLRQTIAQLQDLGAVVVTLTGGEPLLRRDLEDIVAAFDARSSLVLGTTGAGLTLARARRLRAGGLFAVGISLDSENEAEHDQGRGKPGAFRSALRALRTARDAGLYPYVVAVATRAFLEPACFHSFVRFAARQGALEVHLLEPCPAGRLAGRSEVVLSAEERRLIDTYQRGAAGDEALPIVSSFAYLESADAFGCGAGLTHLYIDGSGEVCPCNLVPLSFGNLQREPLDQILKAMARHFRQPRTHCVGRLLAPHTLGLPQPTPLPVSEDLCHRFLPKSPPVPRFFRLLRQPQARVGSRELRQAYNRAHRHYDDFWLSQAARPIDELVSQVEWRGSERVFEAGCGTGYATALLCARARQVVGVDLSNAMLDHARQRLAGLRLTNAQLRAGDALEALGHGGPFDLVFTSWVLGYIPLKPFFEHARAALLEGGRLAFLVHKDNSPREPLELFAELIAADPSALTKQVAFDFPRDLAQVRALLKAAGLSVRRLRKGSVTFTYPTAEQVLEHLIKSGAGTAFHDAVAPSKRKALTQAFVEKLRQRHPVATRFQVTHDFIAGQAEKT